MVSLLLFLLFPSFIFIFHCFFFSPPNIRADSNAFRLQARQRFLHILRSNFVLDTAPILLDNKKVRTVSFCAFLVRRNVCDFYFSSFCFLLTAAMFGRLILLGLFELISMLSGCELDNYYSTLYNIIQSWTSRPSYLTTTRFVLFVSVHIELRKFAKLSSDSVKSSEE